jgi:hypothetical protein
MSASAYYVMTESADERNLPMCKEIAHYLVGAYPGHPWHVRIDGGMLIIKNMRISPTWSMTRKYSAIAHDAKRRKQEVVMAAGAFLEAANMRRGMATGETAKVLEGRLDKNPFKPMADIAPTIEIAKS